MPVGKKVPEAKLIHKHLDDKRFNKLTVLIAEDDESALKLINLVYCYVKVFWGYYFFNITDIFNFFEFDFLANTSVTYLSLELRGLERGDQVWIDEEDPHRLWVYWAGSSPGDYIRVFTAQSSNAMM